MLLVKIKTFLSSLFWHVRRGLPKSSQAEIEARYNICISCDMFESKTSECLVCGCNINKKRVFLNKLAWADQSCPIGKWSKLSK
jgi:hypothetical protein